ncbi:MAG: MOSC domain-containing protein [Pseudomonadota bacterium]
MAVLNDSGLTGHAAALLLHPPGADDITSVPTESVVVSYAGFDGESHSGLTRASCVRVKGQYPEGTEIRNTRQISIVSEEELATIARALEIPAIEPAWLGASLSVNGVEDFTCLPPSTRLIFDGGVSLVIDMENEPCAYPAKVIDSHYPGHGRFFIRHAKARRGVTAWVEREGVLTAGEKFAVHVPTIRQHPGL